MNKFDVMMSQAAPRFQEIARQHQLVSWAEESNFALQAYHRNAGLRECSEQSFRDAIWNVAAVGLTLNPAHGYAYLVPEYNKDAGGKEAQLRISFKGLIKIATDSGVLDWVMADVVKEKDTFIFKGKWEKPEHHMEPFSTERGDSVGVYCVAKMPDGQIITEVAPWSEVLKAKNASKVRSGPWGTWEDEMAKKFIIKRASKQWPKADMADRLSAAVDVVNQAEGSESIVDAAEKAAAVLIVAIESGDHNAIVETYSELSEEEKACLFTAKNKGGWLDTEQKRIIRDVMHQNFLNENPEEREKLEAAKAADSKTERGAE